MVMYHQGNRNLQDAFGSRRLADRLVERLRRATFTEEDAGFIAPRAPQNATPRGQASPETLERLRRAVEHKGERQPQPAPQPAETPRAQSRMAGLGRMLERMAGHADASAPKPPAASIAERVNERVAVRARQQEADFDDLASPDAAGDNVEIPAFLRRQAN